MIRTGKPLTKEEKETWPDGSVTWALSTKMPLRDHTGQIVGTFGISRDITDRKRAEEAMRHAKEAAEEASRTKSQFLASMSHELRTPLNSVIGFANILLKNKTGTLSPAELNFLDRIQANGKHLLGLINEILDLSKIEARKVELQMSPVALDQLVRDTIAQEEGLVRDKPVELLADLPDPIAPILTDADKLRQVLINLIGNALKFTERGNVTVRVLHRSDRPPPHPPGRLRHGHRNPQRQARGHLRGIPAGRGRHGPQVRRHRLGADDFAGALPAHGLPHRSHQRSRTRLDVQRHPARRFANHSASLPAAALATITAPEPLAAPPPTPALNPSALAGKLVLVIDDEADSRTLLTHMIEEAGCHVVSADSGELGLLMARKLRPHLITTDLLMPGMDGWQVLRAIKTDPQLRSIPVVVISVVAGENRGRIFGAVEILQKPVEREELLAALTAQLLAAQTESPDRG